MEILQPIINQLYATSWVEIIGFVSGIVTVYLTVKENIWCWPTGIFNVVAFIFLFYSARLYADMSLQFVFLGLSFYGWYEWLYGGENKKELPISSLKPIQFIGYFNIAIVGMFFFGYLLAQNTNADIPYIDSLMTSLSLVAQYLLARKVLESWIFWILVDIISLWMYYHKGLYLTDILYGIFLVLSIKGYFDWKRFMKGSQENSSISF